jgi:transcriptional regulator with XRE-family HTH domain
MTIGEKIVFFRNEKRWNQEELGERVGASRQALGKYERDEIQPPLDVATKMARLFNISLDYLVGIIDQDPSNDKDSISREQLLVLTKLEKLPKSDRDIIVSVIDAFVYKTLLKK